MLKAPPHLSSTRTPVTPHAEAVTGRALTTKLPKLALQPFNGDMTGWMFFWDLYKVAIHDNDTLSEIEKFTYLRTVLEGVAEEAIKGLSLTASNYGNAILILEARFGNKQQIVSKHMDVLLNMGAVASANDVVPLRPLRNTVESQLRGLHGLGVTSDSYGALLSPVLLKKLPQELRLIIKSQGL